MKFRITSGETAGLCLGVLGVFLSLCVLQVSANYDPTHDEVPNSLDAKWGLISGGNDFIETVYGGFADTEMDANSGLWLYENAGLSQTTGWTFDVRLKIDANNTSGQRALGILLREPFGGQLELQVRKGHFHLFGESHGILGGTIAFDFTDGYHTIRIVRLNQNVQVFLDDELSPRINASFNRTDDFGGNSLYWGKTGSDNAGKATVDYLRLDNTQAIYAAPGNWQGNTWQMSRDDFVLGWYVSAYLSDQNYHHTLLDESARHGFNMIRHADLADDLRAGVSEVYTFMDQAALYDMGVEVYLRPQYATIQTPQQQENIDAIVNGLKDYSSFHAWHIGEEAEDPTFGGHVPINDFIYLSNYVASKDANHPISAVFTGTGFTLYPPYLPYVDIAAVDDYPVRSNVSDVPMRMHNAIKNVQTMVDLSVANGVAENWYVGQAFDTGNFLFASVAQQRYLTLGSLTVGVKGVLYFAYQHTTQVDRETYIYPVTDELMSLRRVINSSTPTPQVTSNRDTSSYGDGLNDVTYLVRQYDCSLYIIAAGNHHALSQNTQFTVSGIQGITSDVTISVLGENRVFTGQVQGGQLVFSDNFDPLSIHIYQIYPVSAP